MLSSGRIFSETDPSPERSRERSVARRLGATVHASPVRPLRRANDSHPYLSFELTPTHSAIILALWLTWIA